MSAFPSPPGPTLWHYQLGAQQLGPIPTDHLASMIKNGVILRTTLVWRDGMPQWAPAGEVPELASHFSAPGTIAGIQPAPHIADAASKKMTAGLLAIFLGQLGIHKFVLGYNTAGIICIVVSVVCAIPTCGISLAIMHIIGIVEGIIYLSKSDQEFYNTYIANQKTWF